MEVNMDDTSQKIIDATMALIRDKGYVATTTKDIAHLAGVNECTLFRKFKNKKDIVLNGVAQEKWRANITPELFQNVVWELGPDLEMFMTAYMDRITPDFVNLSIGLRAPQLYDETAPLIMKVPQAFLSSLIEYFEKMEQLGKIRHMDFESLAMTIFSSTFGYTFLKSSFNQELTGLDREQFIKNSVAVFLNGISDRDF
ncbi:transcriptional regulator, TetR family [[Clostridium] asparagiforme DSM 15981]|uniref:Transcriptional regulator, TetR family n=2 Tax=Enterocloster asparagiformis TaxID=333367 RepID=C0CXV2_9FIRM|nr:transcriptional regulator, TetR family [[Clostridium] asparagiforme DSM 15981]